MPAQATVSVSAVDPTGRIAVGEQHTCAIRNDNTILNHTCVLATDGTVWCWGENGTGAVGDGSLANQPDPVQVTLGGTATTIAAGGNESCAILSSLEVKCWGKNTFGQIGNGTTSAGESVPVSVSKIPYSASIPGSFSVDHLEVGLHHACATSTTGGAWCWGYYLNKRLQLRVLYLRATSSRVHCSRQAQWSVSGETMWANLVQVQQARRVTRLAL
ncbi:MAG: hypothetical protein NTV13_04650 [Actinobacteria bacterium]|nr:hypothetical protein [Actinomycetota bacterium]